MNNPKPKPNRVVSMLSKSKTIASYSTSDNELLIYLQDISDLHFVNEEVKHDYWEYVSNDGAHVKYKMSEKGLKEYE